MTDNCKIHFSHDSKNQQHTLLSTLLINDYMSVIKKSMCNKALAKLHCFTLFYPYPNAYLRSLT